MALFLKKLFSRDKNHNQDQELSTGFSYGNNNYLENNVGSELVENSDSVSNVLVVEEDDYFNTNHSDENFKETIYKKICRWSLLFGVVLVPLLFLPWTSNYLELNKQALILVVVAVSLISWLLDVIMSGKLICRINFLDKGVLLFVFSILLATIFSPTVFKSAFGESSSLSESFVSIFALTLFYFLIVNSFNDRGKAIKYSLLTSLSVALIYGLLQLFGIYLVKFPVALSRVFNTVGYPNVLGAVSAIILPILYKTKPDSIILKYLFKTGMGATLVILIVINWWVLWLLAITGMVAIIIFDSILSVDSKEKFKMSRSLFPMIVMVLGIFLIIINFNLIFVKNKIPLEVAPSYKLSWKIAQGVLQEDFLFGYGPENFLVAFDKYGAEALKNTTVSNARFIDATSQAINFVISNGLVGLLGLLSLLAAFGWSLFKAMKLKVKHLDPEDVGVLSSAFVSIVAMFLYPFNMGLMFVFYILLGLFALVLWGKRKHVYNIEDKASLSLISSLGFIVGLIVSLVTLYFTTMIYVSDIKYTQAINQDDSKEASSYTFSSINWNSNSSRTYKLASQLTINLLNKELNSQPAKNDSERNNRMQDYIASSVTFAKRATEINSRDFDNWTNLGDIYRSLIPLVAGSDVLAEEAYLKASGLRPGDPSFYNQIGSMYLAEADLLRQLALSGGINAQKFNQEVGRVLLKAEDAFKKAVEISNNFGLAIYNLGATYERQGKLVEAIRQLEIITPANRNQPGLAFELGLLYYRNNQKEKAFEELRRAVSLFPDYANARWYLSLLHEERKEIDAAISQLEAILSVEINKNNGTVTKKLEELKSGKAKIPPAKVLDQRPL